MNQLMDTWYSGPRHIQPVYRNMKPQLPTGLAQFAYTKFINLSVLDRASAAPLVIAFSEFDDSKEAWEKYDQISFRDLCIKMGVSKYQWMNACTMDVSYYLSSQ